MPFTAEQQEAMTAAVVGQCEYHERTNTWYYNFSTTPERRQAMLADLFERAASAAGYLAEQLSPEQRSAIVSAVCLVARRYDDRNGVTAPA